MGLLKRLITIVFALGCFSLGWPLSTPAVMGSPAPSPKPSVSPTPSATPSLGQKIFNSNCSACHIGGNNVILAEKNLHLDTLQKYEMDSIVAIKNQVIHGKNAMPAFSDNLTLEEIEAVARYVLSQAAQDWKDSSIDLQSLQMASPRDKDKDKPSSAKKTNGVGS
ncbi:c-type cytochrome [Alkalinema pantanalense CENA528]|uniref:c-type cytochrome n=1 Tax=Alkalinema pantanalense TaxID=1620705 RepID=UPI003D6EB09B